MKRHLCLMTVMLLVAALLVIGCTPDDSSDTTTTSGLVNTTTTSERISTSASTEESTTTTFLEVTTTVTETKVPTTAASTTTTVPVTPAVDPNDKGVMTGTADNVLKMYMSESNMRVKNVITSVGYQVDGQFRDFLFDAFILLPSPAYIMGSSTYRPMDKDDWQNWIEKEFKDGYNADALEEATAQVKTALGNSDHKTGLFLSLFPPQHSVTEWGDVNGKNLDLSVEADRIEALKWKVDESIRQFRAQNYQHVELIGFYWFPESIKVEEDETMLRAITDYVRSLGYITIWSPYYMARGYANWQGCGFDKVSMQANYFPAETGAPNCGGIDRLASTSGITKGRGMGVEVELQGETTNEIAITGFKQYLKTGVERGYMNRYHVYYMNFGPTAVDGLEGSGSRNAYIRSAYDDLYKFIKGTLKVEDIWLKA